MLAYRYEGMRHNDVFKLVKDMKEDLQNEAGPVKERKTRVLFDKWTALAIDQEQRDATKLSRKSTGMMDAIDVMPLDLLSETDQAQMDKVMPG